MSRYKVTVQIELSAPNIMSAALDAKDIFNNPETEYLVENLDTGSVVQFSIAEAEENLLMNQYLTED